MPPVTRSAAARKQPYPQKERIQGVISPIYELKAPSLGNLSNHIHPVFRPRNLHPDLLNTEEAILTPVLRLASQFLLARFNLSFWHTLLFSDVREVEDTIVYSYRQFRSFEFTQVLPTLNSAQEARTERALLRLSKCVRIRGLDFDAEQKGGAYTEIVRKELAGITLNGLDILRIAEHAKNNRHGPRLFCTARLALRLVHELAHAAITLTRSPGHYFFPGAIASEEGYELESRLLGGLMVQQKPGICPSPTSRIILKPWPCQCTVAYHVAAEAPLGLRLLRGRSELHSERGDRADSVLPSYVERLFDQSFWDIDVAATGQEALRPWTAGKGFLKGNAAHNEKLRQAYENCRKAATGTAV